MKHARPTLLQARICRMVFDHYCRATAMPDGTVRIESTAFTRDDEPFTAIDYVTTLREAADVLGY